MAQRASPWSGTCSVAMTVLVSALEFFGGNGCRVGKLKEKKIRVEMSGERRDSIDREMAELEDDGRSTPESVFSLPISPLVSRLEPIPGPSTPKLARRVGADGVVQCSSDWSVKGDTLRSLTKPPWACSARWRDGQVHGLGPVRSP
ncbi:unnamed protein product [Notodromas monacha]|uniref:Uncharacterized protein n=1 Tax=Notodromas monacha TaxID=399045 RepID=A0A7R9GIJ8_9CRUS|nr:unnamed protein product [Notodromas monacha]CAG0924041.1 unnamed protein product [Notodromas monacha]